MYINLELSVDEKFVAYGTIDKNLTSLKSPWAKACYLIQKPEQVIEKVYLHQCFGDNFFLS